MSSWYYVLVLGTKRDWKAQRRGCKVSRIRAAAPIMPIRKTRKVKKRGQHLGSLDVDFEELADWDW